MLRRLFYEYLYFGQPAWDTGVSPPELMAFINSHPPGRALDLGCGTGTNAITLAQHGWQVVGVDFVWRAVRLARRKARQTGVQVDFRFGNVARLRGVASPFDLVLDIGCLHNVAEKERPAYINNLPRLLAPQGTFLLYGLLAQSEPVRVTGLTPADLSLLADRLNLVQRVDGVHNNKKQSAWFTYQL